MAPKRGDEVAKDHLALHAARLAALTLTTAYEQRDYRLGNVLGLNVQWANL